MQLKRKHEQTQRGKDARRNQPPAPKKMRQPIWPVHAMDVPHNSIGTTGHCKKEHTAYVFSVKFKCSRK
jgi:hypothetical protein